MEYSSYTKVFKSVKTGQYSFKITKIWLYNSDFTFYEKSRQYLLIVLTGLTFI